MNDAMNRKITKRKEGERQTGRERKNKLITGTQTETVL